MSSYRRAVFASALFAGVSPVAAFAQSSPITHVIIVVVEHHPFDNPNKKDLFVWVAETAGTGNHNSPPTLPDNTLQGGLSMGFYNMNTGDAPFYKQMADYYAISDNYHQFVMGGTGANFIGLVTG